MAFVDKNREVIVEIINLWQGKMTWNLLCSEVQTKLSLRKAPDRTSLYGDPEIYEAFDNKKNILRHQKEEALGEAKTIFETGDKLSVILRKYTGNDDATIKELAKRVDKVEHENESLRANNSMLKKQNDMILERFAMWQYNLSRMDGVDLNRLEETLENGLAIKDLR
jgi:hypothetical protein